MKGVYTREPKKRNEKRLYFFERERHGRVGTRNNFEKEFYNKQSNN